MVNSGEKVKTQFNVIAVKNGSMHPLLKIVQTYHRINSWRFTDTNNKSAWYCPICIFSQLPDKNLDLSVDQVITSDNIKLLPDENFKKFINSCQNIILHDEDEDENEDNIFTHINSMYYGLHDINNLNNDSSSLGILHTNLASLNKYHDDLEQILSLMKVDFQIIGITEHKIKEVTPISNIKLAGYHEFIYTPTQTSHGGSGFYIQDSLAFKKRNDLLLNSSGPGDFESTFLEIVLPNKKNLIVGCIYRHPSSKITIEDFTKNYLDPILIAISAENKTCALVGDYNIDLLKSDTHDDINLYQNFFSPYILQPISIIDNIVLNTIEYVSYSGNITIQLVDHLFQFILLQGFSLR